MKKNILGAAVLAAILASGALSACSGSPKETTAAATETQAADSRAEDTTAAEAETTQASAELKEIVVGASPAPHAEILNAAKEVLASKGYELKIVEYTDYVQPNNALDSGDLDANYFQHITYMESFNEERGTHLVSAGSIHYEPLGIYPGKQNDLSAITDGAEIAVPNDTTNEARALLLLQEQGLITLNADAGINATVNDITDNPHNISFVELAAEQIPRSLQDFDFAVINGNYALQAGLNASTDALAVETSDSEAVQKYVNVVAVKEGHENDEGIQALVQVLKSDEIKKFIEDTYQGSVVPYEE